MRAALGMLAAWFLLNTGFTPGAPPLVPASLIADAGGQGLQEQWPPEIVVSDPRPLAAVLDELEKRNAWRITYEDPPYLFPADIEDVTEAVSRSTDRSTRTLVPRGGPFTFSYPSPPVPETVLEALIESYHLTSYPGRFQVWRAGDVHHVVPVMGRNTAGILETYTPLLDVRIALPETERDGLATIQAMLQAVSTATGRKVGLGTMPINLFHETRLRTGADDEPARAVLQRTLDATGRPLSWRLLFEPGLRSLCMLNVHMVRRTP